MMVEIVDRDHPVLRKDAEPVPPELFGTKKLHTIIKNMQDALATQSDGAALAAPQINVPLQIFVVSPSIFEGEKSKDVHLVYINPKITRLSKRTHIVEEGCLSVRWLYGEMRRSSNATVEAFDENGERFTRGAGGLLAQIFQHEMDHLDGTLFIDTAKNIREIPPEALQND